MALIPARAVVFAVVFMQFFSVLDYDDVTFRRDAASSTLNTWTLPSGVLLLMLTVPIISTCTACGLVFSITDK